MTDRRDEYDKWAESCLKSAKKILENIDGENNIEVRYFNAVREVLWEYIKDSEEVLTAKNGIDPDLIKKILRVKFFKEFNLFYHIAPTKAGLLLMEEMIKMQSPINPSEETH